MDGSPLTRDFESLGDGPYKANSWLSQAEACTSSTFLSHDFYSHESPLQDYSRGAVAGGRATACGSTADECSGPVDILSDHGAATGVAFPPYWSVSSNSPPVFTAGLGLDSLAFLSSSVSAIDDNLAATAQDGYSINNDTRKADDFDDEGQHILNNHRPERLRGRGPVSNGKRSSTSGPSSKDEENETPTAHPRAKRSEKALASPSWSKNGQQGLPRPPSNSTTGCGASSRLRKACRKAERSPPSPLKAAETTDELRARASHNAVEKQYRNRLNTQFERLLSVLPDPQADDDNDDDGDDRPLSKAEVLDRARRRIKSLESECELLKQQRSELLVDVGLFRDAARRREAEE
jgi:hypothetical protein